MQVQAGTQPARPYTVVGVVTIGDIDSLGGATLTVFDTADRPARAARTRDSSARSRSPLTAASRRPSSPSASRPSSGKSADVVTGDQLTQETSNGIKNGLGFFTLILQVFGGVALVVGLFIIANTFSMLVGQRARELALLRAVGASRAQVVRSVLAEGLAVGIVGSVVGLAAGIGIAIGVKKACSAPLGVDIPSAGIVVESRTVIVALVLGIVVTTLAALFAGDPGQPGAAGRGDVGDLRLADEIAAPARGYRAGVRVAGLAILFSGTSRTGSQGRARRSGSAPCWC